MHLVRFKLDTSRDLFFCGNLHCSTILDFRVANFCLLRSRRKVRILFNIFESYLSSFLCS